MVVIMKPGFTPEQLQQAIRTMEAGGVKVMVSKGSETTILGAEGNAAGINQEELSLLPGVDRVMRVTGSTTRTTAWWTWEGAPWWEARGWR